MRRDYRGVILDEALMHPDPMHQFRLWMDEVVDQRIPEPNAMVLATVDAEGLPNARIVLLKACDPRGFSFFTSCSSTKGRELATRPAASLVFPWHPINRQVRVRGTAEPIGAEEVSAYFATRPRGAQLAALASRQSEPLESRDALRLRYEQLARHHGDDPLPKPDAWGGYRVVPLSIEFWSGRPNRLHDRIQYTRATESSSWDMTRLNP
jgi:pyridoxamine 5'-phosphate oxidase